MNVNEIESKNGTLSINKQTVIQRKNIEQRNIFNEAEATLGVAKNRLGPAGMFSQSPIGNISGHDFYEVSNENYTFKIRQNTSLMSEGRIQNMNIPTLGQGSVYETYKKVTDNSYADTLRFEEFSSLTQDDGSPAEVKLTEEEIANNSDGFGFKQGSVELSKLSLNYRHKDNPFRDGNYKALTDGKFNNADFDYFVAYNGYPFLKTLNIHNLYPTWSRMTQEERENYFSSLEKDPQNSIGSTVNDYREQVYNAEVSYENRFVTQSQPGLGYYTTEGDGTHATKVENLSSTAKIRLGDYFTRKYN